MMYVGLLRQAHISCLSVHFLHMANQALTKFQELLQGMFLLTLPKHQLEQFVHAAQ